MRAFTLLLILVPVCGFAQNPLQSRIAAIAKGARGSVGVSCMLPGTKLNCDLNPHNHAPMQSMYKLPLALTALHLAEMGKLLPDQRPGESIDTTLNRTVRFLPMDIFPGYSPLTDRYPKADVDVTLREVIRLAVGVSDNGAEEILIRLVGGPLSVESYVHSLGIAAIQVRYSELDLYHNKDLHYQDWIEPTAAVELLERLVTNLPVSPTAAVAFLLKTMADSQTGTDELRAGLPPGTVLAHKTGHSGTHGGITAATNDIGLVTLPDGRRLAIAVFVTDSRANDTARARVIAHIARVVHQEALITR